MAICWYLQKNFEKSKDNAQKSIEYNKSIKAYYRLGQSYKALGDFESAITSYKNAIKMDVSDPNDIQSELMVVERLEKAKEKKRLMKLSE